MTTELAVDLQQTLNDKDKPTNAVMTEEFKDQPSNDMSTKNDLSSAEMRDMDDNDKYEFNYRLVLLFPFTFIIFLSYNPEFNFLKISYKNNVLRIVIILIIVYHSFLILFGFAIFIFCIIYKKPFTKFVNALFGFVSSNNQNAANGNVSDVFEFEQRQYAGLWLFASIIYSSAVTILDVTYDLYTRDLNLRLPVQTRLIPLALNLTFFIFYKTVNLKCHQKIKEEKKLVLEKYKNTGKMANKIKKSLQVWQESKKLTNRRVEFIAICLFMVFWYYIPPVIIWEIYKKHDTQTAVLITIIFVFDIPFLVFIFYWMNTVYLHFKFPSIIMAELAVPINTETMNDLIGWWQLRHFYAQCVVKTHISSFGVYIAALIFCSIMAVIAVFFSVLGSVDFNIETVLIAIVLCYVISITFFLVSNATNYHSIQLSHANMLRVESIALRKYKADNIDAINDIYDIELSKYENDMQHYVINELMQDVQNNSDIIQVFGVSINSNFMLLLRAASGTVAIAIISILFS